MREFYAEPLLSSSRKRHDDSSLLTWLVGFVTSQ